MSTVVVILFAVALVNLGLGVFVCSYNSKQETNRVFAITCVSIALWTLTNALFQTTPSISGAIIWANLSYISTLILATSFLHFSWVYPLVKPLHRHARTALWIGASLLCLLPLIPGLVIEAVEFDQGRRIVTNAGLYPIALFLFGTLSLALLNFWKAYGRTRGNTRSQLRYVLTGAALTIVLGLIANLVFPLLSNYRYVWLGPTSSLFFVTFTVYSIVAHKLFDIRILLQRTLVYTILLGLLSAVYGAVALGLTNFLSQVIQVPISSFSINLIGAVLIGFGVEPLRRWLERATDSFLFRRDYEEQRVLNALTSALNEAVALDDVLDALLRTLQDALHIERAIAYVFHNANEEITLKRLRQIGYASPAKLFPLERDGLLKYFENYPTLIMTDDLNESKPPRNRGLRSNTSEIHPLVGNEWAPHVFAKLTTLQIALALPLIQNKQLIGLLLLGSKQSGEKYSLDDRELLQMLGTQAVSAIQKAIYYEGDQQKSEFVPIASHELLTPITAIEGYASMILDDGMGKVDEQARGYLSKIATSSHRLSTLVKDLLSVSRIEAGRLKIEPQAFAIEKLLEDTVDQFRFMAQEKNLRLIYEKPVKPLLPVWADSDRVMQVLVNLVSNGIKYTSQGSVTVSAKVLSASQPQVQITVSDTGLGMSAEAQKHLFEKFYRVATPETAAIAGTGLGLYITKTLIEKMGGRMIVQSTLGQGTKFSVSLPVASSQSTTAV